jgi:hypothetical protein
LIRADGALDLQFRSCKLSATTSSDPQAALSARMLEMLVMVGSK